MLVARGLRKHFGSVRAVDGVDFKIGANEIVALVGPNGAGKTTFINLISGYLEPDAGEIRFMGRDITRLSPEARTRLGIGRSFQIPSLFEGVTVLDNVRTALLSARRKTRSLLKPADAYEDITREALEILRVFNLHDKAELRPTQLPEGDRKVLDVAIAFSLKPKLMLLDEPTAGVATKDKFRVMDVIVSVLRERRSSALIVEHDLDVVESYSDRVALMHSGRIIAEGKPSEILGELKRLGAPAGGARG